MNSIADDFEHQPNAPAVIHADGSNYREIVCDEEFRRDATWIS